MATPPKKLIRCPSCDHEQLEYAEAVSTTCSACGKYIQLHAFKRRKFAKKQILSHQKHDVRCFHCGHVDLVPESTLSWQCTGCGAHIDLETHTINKTQSTNIFTYGGVIVTPNGNFIGARIEAGWMKAAGSIAGVIVCKDKIIINGPAKFKANVSGIHLEIDPGASLESKQLLEFETICIKGKLDAKQVTASKSFKVTSIGEAELDTVSCKAFAVEHGGLFKGKLISYKEPLPEEEKEEQE